MTEKKKMLSGRLYNAAEAELCKERAEAKDKTFRYNQLHPNDQENRNALLKELFGKTGKHLWVEAPFQCDYGKYITVGENFYANHNCVMLDGGGITIGDNVLLAPNVGIYTAGHPLDVERRNAGLEYALPIVIGNNVWIGAGVSVLPGVTIGDNTVIGAGSVVTKDLPANVLAAGNPCRVLREITEEDKKKFA